MIYYIQEENFSNEYTISDVINKMPKFIHLEEIEQLIKNNKKLFTVNSFIDLYNKFEHLCWDEIKGNINEQYKKPLTEQEKKNLEKYFNNPNGECLINKLNLSTALRRYISKYLSGLIEEIIIKDDRDLLEELKKPELWDYSFAINPLFEKEIEIMKKCFKVTVGHAMDLYNVLGGDEILKPKFINFNKEFNNNHNKDEKTEDKKEKKLSSKEKKEKEEKEKEKEKQKNKKKKRREKQE